MFKTRKFWLFLALGVSACLWQAGYRVRAQKAAESNRAAGPAQTTQNSDIPEPGLIIKGQSKSYEGVSGNAGKASVVDFKVIAKKSVNIKRRTKDGDGPEPDVDFMPAPDGWQRAAPAPGTKPQAPIDTAKHILPGVPAPAPSSSFLASEDEDMDIPPDTHGAVGPNHIVSATNTRIRIQSRTGTVLSTPA